MAEFVIVGGGVYGCAAAWELAKRGAEVTVLEADRVACGASGGLGKRGVRANGRDLRELPLMRAAHQRWPDLGAELGADIGFERTGHLQLYERERDIAGAGARAWAQTQAGIPTRVLDRQGLRNREPRVSDAVQLALHCSLDGIADHTATTLALAAAAQAHGAEIRERAAVASIERSGERVRHVVLDTGETVPVGRGLLLLANASTPALVEEAFDGWRLPVWSMLPQVMRTTASPLLPFRSLIGHAHRTLALKRLPDDSAMISGGWRGRWNAALGRGETVREQVNGNWNEALAVYPALAELEIAEADASRPETVSVDGIPIIAELVPGVFIACGWCGHGWAIAPAVAELLAQWVTSGERPALLAPFGYERF